ncbi:MAG: Abortive infection protein [Acidimicrobiaceae bacterium]|nr:Abortive infection protein [Acidimicrobiaceae bacterium]
MLAIVVAGFVGFLAGQFLGLLLESVGVALTHYPGGLSALGRAPNPPWWSSALGFLGIWTGFAAAIVYAHLEGRLRPLPHQWVPHASDALYVVVGVAMQFIVDLLYRPFHFKSLNHPVNHLFKATHGPGFVAIAIMTTLIAPVFEEWLFRGVIFRAIAEGSNGVSKKTAVVLGVVISAVLFGAAHGELVQFAGLVLLGVVLAILLQRTQRLVPSYLAHASFNATALVAVIAQRAGH